MRRLQALAAVVLLGTMFLLLVFSNWQVDMAHVQHRIQEQPLAGAYTPEPPAVPPKVREVHKHLSFNVTVSDHFRKFFTHNVAYWSRLLHARLRHHNKSLKSTPPVEWRKCWKANSELLKTNVHDFDAYPDTLKDFLHGLNCRDPPQLIDQPQKCFSDGDGTFLLLAIKSAPTNFQRRQVVRETWGREGTFQGGLRVRTIFLLGSLSNKDPDLQPLLEFEARNYGDMLQWDFHESLFNLTLKAHVFLNWTQSRCPDASFVFSGDDDVFVNTPAILKYLQTRTPEAASQIYVGEVISVASPIRDPKSKYYIPQSFYENVYPLYTGGGGYLIAGALLRRLFLVSALIPLFPIDDVYIGMCMDALGIVPELHKGFRTFDVMESQRENMCVTKELMMIHRRTPREIKWLWKGIHSPFLTC